MEGGTYMQRQSSRLPPSSISASLPHTISLFCHRRGKGGRAFVICVCVGWTDRQRRLGLNILRLWPDEVTSEASSEIF